MTPRRSRDGTLSSALLLVANLLIPAAILIFATGFFPYKPLLPGLASYNAVTEYGDPPAAPFDKVVFMVIDALRRYRGYSSSPSRTLKLIKCLVDSDFVYTADSGFEYTQS
jgi:ethanolaminephosphotransferase